MSEQLHLSLSSVMDGQDDDLELPRLLEAMHASPKQAEALGNKWWRYHLAQGVMRGDLRQMQASSAACLDLSSKIRWRLDAEQTQAAFHPPPASVDLQEATSSVHSEKTQESIHCSDLKPARAWFFSSWFFGSWFPKTALAASLGLLVLVGVQTHNAGEDQALPLNSAVLVPSPLVQMGLPDVSELQTLTLQQDLLPQQEEALLHSASSHSVKETLPLPFSFELLTGRSWIDFALHAQAAQPRHPPQPSDWPTPLRPVNHHH